MKFCIFLVVTLFTFSSAYTKQRCMHRNGSKSSKFRFIFLSTGSWLIEDMPLQGNIAKRFMDFHGKFEKNQVSYDETFHPFPADLLITVRYFCIFDLKEDVLTTIYFANLTAADVALMKFKILVQQSISNRAVQYDDLRSIINFKNVFSIKNSVIENNYNMEFFSIPSTNISLESPYEEVYQATKMDFIEDAISVIYVTKQEHPDAKLKDLLIEHSILDHEFSLHKYVVFPAPLNREPYGETCFVYDLTAFIFDVFKRKNAHAPGTLGFPKHSSKIDPYGEYDKYWGKRMCPSTWRYNYVTKMCYKILHFCKSFDDCQSQCREYRNVLYGLEGNLASIHSSEEEFFVQTCLDPHELVFDRLVLFGMKKIKDEWQWIDNTPIDYQNWRSFSRSEKNCSALVLSVHGGNQWNVTKCTDRYQNAICKMPRNELLKRPQNIRLNVTASTPSLQSTTIKQITSTTMSAIAHGRILYKDSSRIAPSKTISSTTPIPDVVITSTLASSTRATPAKAYFTTYESTKTNYFTTFPTSASSTPTTSAITDSKKTGIVHSRTYTTLTPTTSATSIRTRATTARVATAFLTTSLTPADVLPTTPPSLTKPSSSVFSTSATKVTKNSKQTGTSAIVYWTTSTSPKPTSSASSTPTTPATTRSTKTTTSTISITSISTTTTSALSNIATAIPVITVTTHLTTHSTTVPAKKFISTTIPSNIFLTETSETTSTRPSTTSNLPKSSTHATPSHFPITTSYPTEYFDKNDREISQTNAPKVVDDWMTMKTSLRNSDLPKNDLDLIMDFLKSDYFILLLFFIVIIIFATFYYLLCIRGRRQV